MKILFNQVSEQQIYKMIHKSSSSTVKLIFIISILEFILWTVLSLLYERWRSHAKQFNDYHVEHIMNPFIVIRIHRIGLFFLSILC
jgi:hypothetical protein